MRMRSPLKAEIYSSAPVAWQVAAAIAVSALVGFGLQGAAHASPFRPAAEKPSEAAKILLRAEKLIDEQKFAEARPLIEQVQRLAPKWLRPKGLLGMVFQAAAEREKALEQYATMEQGILEGPAEQVEFVARCAAELMWLVNDERMRRGLHMLKPHPLLALAAMHQAQDMRDFGFFDHFSPVPGRQTPADRVREVMGFRPYQVAENIASRRTNDFALTLENIRRTHSELMGSPGHAHNILNAVYTDFGVGLAANRRGDYWVCEVFVRFARP